MNIDWTHIGGWIAAVTLLAGWLWRHTSTVRRMALFEGRTLAGIEKINADLSSLGKEMKEGFDTVHKRIDDHLEATIARKRK